MEIAMEKIWKDLPESNGTVFVSNDGVIKTERVFRKSIRTKVLKQSIDKKGYCRVGVWIDGKLKTLKAHRIVATAFIPNPENKPQINHKNGIKTDNRVENLEWVTNKENIQHAFGTGLKVATKVFGEQHGHTKTTNEQILEIVKKVKSGVMLKDVAVEYGLSRSTVTDIMKGNVWSHITKIKSGKDLRKVLSKEDVLKIVEMRKSGMTAKSIAHHFNIGYTTVSDICNGKSNWKITGIPKAR
jgi:hypothetical protein